MHSAIQLDVEGKMKKIEVKNQTNNSLRFLQTSLFAVVSIFISINVFAASAGTTGGEFLKINPNPEVVGMGESAIGAYMNQPSIMQINPAGLLGVNQARLSINHIAYVEGISYNYTGFAMPLSYGAVGFSVAYLSYGSFEGRDVNFTPISVADSNDAMFTASYCLPLKKTIPVVKEYGSIGMNFKFIRSTLAEYTAEAVAVDLGAIYKIPFVRDLNLGIAYKNIGSGLKYVKETNSLPQTIGVGLNYRKYEAKDLNIVADVNMPDKAPMSVSCGVSIAPVYFLSLRAGYKMTENAFNSGLRAGIGLNFDSIRIDYAFTPVEYFTPVHNISIGIPVGNIFSTELASEHYLNKHFRIGMDYYRSGDYVYAKEKFQEILDAYPDHKPSRKYMDKVNKALEELKKKQEVRVKNYIIKGNEAVEAKDYISARKYFSYAISMDDSNNEARGSLKVVEETLRSIEAEKRRQINTVRIVKEWNAAMKYLNTGEYMLAKEKLDIILKIDPENKEAEKYVLSIENKLKLIAATEVGKIYSQAILLYNKGSYEQALRYFEAVILAAPDRLDAKDFADKCKTKINDAKEKERTTQIAQKQDKVKDQFTEVYNKAIKYYERGKLEQALNFFGESSKMAAEYEFSDELGRIKNYISMIKTGLAEQYYREGFASYQKNNFEEAAKLYNQALRYDPDNSLAKTELEKISKQLAQGFYEKGMTYFSQGELENAKVYFQKSLSYNPQMKESQRALERIK